MTVHLTDLESGTQGMVHRINGGHSLVSRLAALGFTPGAPVTVLRSGSGGPLLVSIRGGRVALGVGEAENIEVLKVSGEGVETPPSTPASSARVIALAGQPNVGKSTVFNLLTGMNQHVGNWTGKTVEQKKGDFTYKQAAYTLVDLPGTYSLTAASEEERIAREFILHEHPDLVVAVVDAAVLERSLYLVAELLLLPAPVILALNMMDVAEKEGVHVEPKVLETALGIPVVPMAASHNQGVQELLETIEAMEQGNISYHPNRPSILPAHREVLAGLQKLIEPATPPELPASWAALKLLEGDEELIRLFQTRMSPEEWEKVHALLYQHEDAILDIAGARYEWIARMVRAAVVEPQVSRVGLTARLDRTLTHPLWGTLILVGILGLVFWLTYTIGSPIQNWLSSQVLALQGWVRSALVGTPRWVVELLAGGVLGGMGMVLTFLPILAIFYAVLGFLEDTGYLARAAYLTDRWMHQMGLHGKSFLPLLLGFGCNVPAVLGTRIIESKRARLLTILLVPLVPCTARLAVVTILAPIFFGSSAVWVAWALVGGNVLLLAGLGMLLHRFAFEDEHVAFIMELPLYHLPNFKTIGIYVWQNLVGFLEKAGKVILAASLVVWALSYFPGGDVHTSYLSTFGRWIAPVGQWMGLPWQMLVALLTSVVAKENTIATLGVLYGDIHTVLPTLLTAPAALALLVFQMLFIPCIATVASIRQETASWKWTAFSVALMLGLALGFAVMAYQMGTLLA